jgi:hypothetical protein
MARSDPQFNIRMPAALKARIEASAKESKRTLNAEVITLLEEALETRARRGVADRGAGDRSEVRVYSQEEVGELIVHIKKAADAFKNIQDQWDAFIKKIAEDPMNAHAAHLFAQIKPRSNDPNRQG